MIRSWIAENQSLRRLSKHQNLRWECYLGIPSWSEKLYVLEIYENKKSDSYVVDFYAVITECLVILTCLFNANVTYLV